MLLGLNIESPKASLLNKAGFFYFFSPAIIPTFSEFSKNLLTNTERIHIIG